MRGLFLIFISLTFSIVISSSAYAKQLKFIIDDALGKDNVSFTSDAPIELIVGRTNMITGEVILDESLDLSKSPVNVFFSVDLASIDTGIALRNEHMRDNFLHTKKYPEATFKVKKISVDAPKLSDGEPVKLIAKGALSIHGITVEREIPVKVTYFKESEFTHNRFEHGDLIKVQSSFDIPFKDHKIQRPEVLFQKLTDTVTVTVDVYANLKANN